VASSTHNPGDKQHQPKGDAVSQSGDHLKSGQLGTADVTASTVANIGPGIDFYFAFGVIAVTAGVAAPLTIVAAGVAVVLLAFTVAEFTKAEPSAGSFITYVETALGCGVPEFCLACELQRCGRGRPWDMMIGRVLSPALSDLRSALRMAGPAQSLARL
jgi:hypothetical protein